MVGCGFFIESIKLEVISMNLCKSLVLVTGIALSINSVGAMQQPAAVPAQESRICTFIKNHPWYSAGIAYGLGIINYKTLKCVADVQYCENMPEVPLLPIAIFGTTAAICYQPAKQFCYEPAKKVLTGLYRWAKTKLGWQ
jgi:hypothetical protein